MLGRAVIGAGALGAYAWRVEDPKGSYAAFYDLSDWLTGLVLTGEGIAGYLRNFVNLILIDQADGFLLGMAFFALLSLIFWPFAASFRWGTRKLRQRNTGRSSGKKDRLYFDEPQGRIIRTDDHDESHRHHWR